MLSDELRASVRTHEVENQPGPLEDYNLFASDVALQEALRREGADWASPRLDEFGAALGSAHMRRHCGTESGRPTSSRDGASSRTLDSMVWAR